MADPQQQQSLGYYAKDLPSIKHLSEWWTRFSTNTGKSLTEMTAQNWIRLIIIVGSYLLLRPYLLKLGARIQRKQFEKEQKKDEEERAAAGQGGMNANDLRAGRRIDIPGVDSDSEDEEGGTVATGGEWGRKARVRQRRFVRRAVEETERRLYEKGTESDKEIEDMLED